MNRLEESAKIVETLDNFRDYLIPLDHPRLDPIDRSARDHVKITLEKSPFVGDVLDRFRKNYDAPYEGFTVDGTVVKGLWQADVKTQGPTKEMVQAAKNVLSTASVKESKAFRYPVDAREWRAWCNAELIVIEAGLRLEEMSTALRNSAHALLQASLSAEGYAKICAAMTMNEFLGDLTQLRRVMNADSYHFCMFGDPSEDKPWGFNLYGHHLCINIFNLKGELIIGPFFIGAEPNVIDAGPNEGMTMLTKEEDAGLTLMKLLSANQQATATIRGDINDIDGSTMEPGRWHPGDLRHLAGAFQDNRVLPFEGLCAKDMTEAQQTALLRIVSIYNELLPSKPRELFMRRVSDHLDETYFAWIGPVNDQTPFYFRVHSPVVMNEFDHHNGVWLANALPKKYHIHTIQRLPNRGDYGVALYDEWRKQQEQVIDGQKDEW